MTAPQISINLIRAFEGPRHKKLERVWQYAANFHFPDARLHILDNPGGRDSHAHCLNRIWDQERRRPERYAVLSEFDFLPDPDNFLDLDQVNEEYPVAAVEYVTRDPYTRKLLGHGFPGAWYILVDKQACPDLDFTAGGPFNDPANELAAFVRQKYNKAVRLLFGVDQYPRHYGVRYPQGTHLFFSRHYNDHPSTTVAGFCLWDILKKVDDEVDRFIRHEL